MGAHESRAELTWTSHQVMSLNEMDIVAGDALENQRKSLLNEATTERERGQRRMLAGRSTPLV